MTDSIINIILGYPRGLKRFIVLLCDIFICIASAYLSFYLKFDILHIPFEGFILVITSITLAIPLIYYFNLYLEIIRYSGLSFFIRICKSMGLYAIFCFILFDLFKIVSISKSTLIIYLMTFFLLISFSRFFARIFFNKLHIKNLNNGVISRILIYGTGPHARNLLNYLKLKRDNKVIGFITNNPEIVDSFIDDIKIYSENDLTSIIEEYKISEVLLADSHLNSKQRSKILNFLLTSNVRVRTISPYVNNDVILNNKSIIQELDLDDLLCREIVEPHADLMHKQIFDKVILVTGAGGSIGGEILRQAIFFKPKSVILVEQSEYSLYKINQELISKISVITNCSIEIVPLLGSIQDEQRMHEIISNWKPDIIFHAAAYKHVPIVENNPTEGLLNNIYGTWVMAELAVKYHVRNFVLISTDKAVNPTNIMGASKRISEMTIQAFADKYSSNTCIFSIVRFGNVLGSSGSVVPKFREQIRNLEPLTITHKDVTRYFMSISEAAQLVIQSSALAKGGDLFFLDMGQPVRILDLAVRMIRLSGLRVFDKAKNSGDIKIEFTGLRHGEKLHEELVIGNNYSKTKHPKIMSVNESFLNYNDLKKELIFFKLLIKERNYIEIDAFLKKFVTGYNPINNI